ncbi:putative glutamyl-tRNA amidotransferase subunit a [Rosellinia necatrix]|uniref:Putative glutamyl-tRNA amidotransferase subunit a n=1 Tax=Rosellinia necatrix TaxID=77044 RepID=A0A1S7UK49_ROSNE|nr:putative glutamyl-tRNA amidotransferase subunit a [Rosellinia necatrix]
MASVRFSGYPRAREGPPTSADATEESNPVLRGWPLVVAANAVGQLPFLAKVIWTNAKFGTIQDLPGLEQYDYCLRPIVTPLTADASETSGPKLLQPPPDPQPDPLPGRFYSAADYYTLYRSGALSPLQVAKALIPLISREQNGKYVAAWSETRVESVLAAAEASAERYRRGEPLGFLDGVPIGVKEDTDVEGYTSYYGQRPEPSDPDFKPAIKSLWPVAQMQAAGAVIVGTLAMHELGSDVTGCNPRRGSPKNWYNTSYYTGGSSSGAGSALSAGLIPIAIGTDAGGSIRIPSSFCGVFGLKPTLHRTCTMKSSICVTGPLAATAADLKIAYRTMTSPDPEDAIQSSFAPSIPPSPISKKTLGICRAWVNSASPVVRESMDRAIDYFSQKLNYEVVDIDIPYLHEGLSAHCGWALTEAVDHIKSRLKDRWLSTVNHPNRILLLTGECTAATDMLKYSQLRTLLMEHLSFLFKKYPGLLIVTPTTPEAGWKVSPGDEAYGFSDGNKTVRMMMYIWLANSTGCPAVSAPIGFAEPEQGEGKLPIGLMAMGEWGAEEQLLAWAADAEAYLNYGLEGGRVRPGGWADVVRLANGTNVESS